METKDKTAFTESADWDDDSDSRTAAWEVPLILAVVATIAVWRTFRTGFEELPTWLYQTFGHVFALTVMGIMVFPEIRWWFVAAFAAPCALSVFAAGLTGMMEAIDPSGAEDWFGKDSEFWLRRTFFFAVISAILAPLAYLR